MLIGNALIALVLFGGMAWTKGPTRIVLGLLGFLMLLTGLVLEFGPR